MSEAVRTSIGELVSFRGGGTPSKLRADYYAGHIPWVTPKDMKCWEIRTAQDKITEEAVASSATNLIPEMAVLIVNRSGILKHTVPVGINRLPVAINQDLKALICGPKVLPEYLARMVKAAEPIILSWVRATTADNFPIENLKQLEIPLPSLDEQRRIAKILDQADALRLARHNSVGRLHEFNLSLFNQMFVVGERSDWPVLMVADIAENIRTGPFGSQLLHSEFVDEGIAVLGIDNAVKNEFAWDQRRFISLEKYQQLKRFTVQPGDVLITIMGTCGRCAIVPDDIPTAINTKHLCCITLDQGKALPAFLHAMFLNHPSVLKQLGVQAKGAVMPGLNMGIIRTLSLRLPPLDLQRAFVGKVATAKQLQSRLRQGSEVLEALFVSLQHRAFRGEL